MMALETAVSVAGFPSASPRLLLHLAAPRRSAFTRVGFSRWNNANAEPHILRDRSQQAIEEELRLAKKAELAEKIASGTGIDACAAGSSDPAPFRSAGTPSSPSRPSIPGKKSKYSRNHNSSPNSHPAFRRARPPRVSRIPAEEAISVKEGGLSYLVPGAPFEFQYSYTEAPKVKPLALREPLFVPFGPGTMPRPWTGRAPMPPSKKKLPEFDSFRLPPPNKKGVKPVQAPGPFVPGTGPKYVESREDVLGEPLTPEEIKALVQSCIKSRRQLSMGRDGLTHNMLENIHALWKRRRVCKIKCIGVCTVDMDNIRQQLEEKTGGKIIYSRGGVLYLFRGRNYNYRTRPRFPLMLWKPVTPVYPKLIRRVPEGLTLEEVTDMRKKGDSLPPICKLGKNGFYGNLVKHVREAFEECELVRINCQGMNPSDYKKIGGKLKDLVPCVLISFEKEHILMWRGREWRSSLPQLENDVKQEIAECTDSLAEQSETALQSIANDSESPTIDSLDADERHLVKGRKRNDIMQQNAVKELAPSFAANELLTTSARLGELAASSNTVSRDESISMSENISINGTISGVDVASNHSDPDGSLNGEPSQEESACHSDRSSTDVSDKKGAECLVVAEKVFVLRQQAVETGMALIFDDESLDANAVYEKAVNLAKTAPQGPVFKLGQRKVVTQKGEKPGKIDITIDVTVLPEDGGSRSRKGTFTSKNMKEPPSSIARDGSLGVAELAKLLG